MLLLSIQILFCCLLPVIIAAVGCGLSFSACYRHPTVRQLVCTATVLTANGFAIAALTQTFGHSGMVSILPVAMIFLTCMFAMVQFAIAFVLGAIDRLRQRVS